MLSLLIKRDKKQSFFANDEGSTLIMLGLLIPLFITAAGVAVDIARMHAAYGKAQNALDAAVLGAAASSQSLPDITTEAQNIFNTNYPPYYLGTTQHDFTITKSAGIGGIDKQQVFDGSMKIDVPMTLMSLLGKDKITLNIQSQATLGLTLETEQRVELAMVLDSTRSMNKSGKIDGLKQASADLMDILFDNKSTLPNLFVSVIPYSSSIRIPVPSPLSAELRNNIFFYYLFLEGHYYVHFNYLARSGTYLPGISNIVGLNKPGKGYQLTSYLTRFGPELYYLSNRDIDLPKSNNPYEYTDDPPTSDATRFRSNRGYMINLDDDARNAFNAAYASTHGGFEPLSYPSSYYSDSPGSPSYPTPNFYNPDLPQGTWYDIPSENGYELPPILFASGTKAYIMNTINSMQPTGDTRINVGLMWGWYTLSPKWQAIWDAGRPSLPLTPNEKVQKILILMTDGRNTIYTGDGVTVSNDNDTTATLCNNIKASGIDVYTVGFGSDTDIDQDLLRNCASRPENYFYAPTSDDLKTAFHAIGDSILQYTVRLSK